MRRSLSIRMFLPILAFGLLAGCSREPDSGTPTGLVNASPADAPVFLTEPSSPMAVPLGGGGSMPTYTTRRIMADRGGVVQFGRFLVRIPAGALAADTDITVRDAGEPFVACELEPHGLQFLIPVTLEVSLRGLDCVGFNDWTVYWVATPGLWVDQDATFDPRGARLQAELWHFSTYVPGRPRAGW